MQGIYFYSDYCKGEIWGLQRVSGSWQSQLLTDTNLSITSYGQDENGELYLASTSGVYQHDGEPVRRTKERSAPISGCNRSLSYRLP